MDATVQIEICAASDIDLCFCMSASHVLISCVFFLASLGFRSSVTAARFQAVAMCPVAMCQPPAPSTVCDKG